MTARLIAATVALLLAPAAAASGQVQVQPLDPCYAAAGVLERERQGVAVSASGFPANAPIDVLVDGEVQIQGHADPYGVVSGVTVLAPYVPRGERRFTVTVRQTTEPAVAASARSRVTNLAVTLKPTRARPSRRVRYRGRGFLADQPVWAHYVFNGKARKTVRLVRRPERPCGSFSVRRRQIPVERPRTGEWLVQVDQRRDYVANPGTNWVHVLINVARVFREPEGRDRR
jgi:hypothetical protein